MLDIDGRCTPDEIRTAVAAWVEHNVPGEWRQAAGHGRSAIRAVRTRADYEAWYPTFAESGLVAPTWPSAYGGLDLAPEHARVVESVLAPYNLGRLNPLGLNNTAPALFAHGSEQQRLRFLPPIVANTERWCQLFSEPGAGSDLASLATRAERDGDEWIVTGQKVWTTWAHRSEFAICLVRTDPTVAKRKGITYLLVDLRSPGVDVRELRHMGGEVDFNEVWLDEVRVPDDHRVGAVGDGWRVAGSTLAAERRMISGSGSGGVDRIGGSGSRRLIDAAVESGGAIDPRRRQELMALYSEERVRGWTNERGASRAGPSGSAQSGAAQSVGKVHQAALNQRMQLAAHGGLGMAGIAWSGEWLADMPFELRGMIRSRANTIEGGTTEVNKNVIGERVLGLPRDPDPWHDTPWEDTPRS